MGIELLNETDVQVDLIALRQCAQHVMRAMRVHPDAELCITLVDEPSMERLHIQWMDLEGATDVLSFPMDELRPPADDEEPVEGVLGDIVLCPEYAQRNIGQAGHGLEQELLLLTTHGILHLLGYDHAEPAEHKVMFDLQRRLLLDFLGTRPLPPAAGAHP